MSGFARAPLLAATLLCAALAGRAGATGEHTLSTFFEYRGHADLPLDDFVAGRLGVLQPELRRDHLALAFRALRGGKLDAHERAGALELLRARLRLPAETAAARKAGEARVAAWLRARLLVKGAPPASAIDAYKESALWVEYANCLPDAFDSAARALRERVTRLGADAIEVRGWLAAQDRVFAACGPPPAGPPGSPAAPPPPLPEELPEAAPAATRADRDYQIAAAHFYSGHFEEAVERFHRIARQPDSPWAPLGNYLAARALIRKASLGPTADRVALVDAEHELSTLLGAAGEDEAARDRVQRLLSLVEARLHPEEQARALARRVARGSRDLRNDLGDYLWLLSRTRPVAAGEAPLLDLTRLRTEDELTDWVLTIAGARRGDDDEARRASGAAAFAHALSRYRAAPEAPWLAAALMLAPGGRATAGVEVADLVDAGLRLPDGSPAHDTAVYHALRLQLDSERPERVAAARRRLDALLPGLRAARPSSTLNRFLALRLRAAASLDDLVDFAQRFALGAGREDDDLEVPDELTGPGRRRPPAPRLDDDGAALWRTRLPVAALARLLDHPRLAEGLKAELTRALLVRALALDDGAAVQKLLPAAAALPAEPPAWREGIEAMAAAGSDEERAFAATLMMLRLPGLRPWVDAGLGRQAPLAQKDEFRDNWWCAPGAEGVLRSRALSPAPAPPPPPAFLTDGERKAAEAEVARLERAGAGANLMAARTLDFARTHPDDPRLPEALFLVNRATHYGCIDDKTSGWSKQAYLALHRQWPRSEWARRVKYWW